METLRRRALILDYLCSKTEESAASITEIYKFFKTKYNTSNDRKTFERDIIYLSTSNSVIEIEDGKRTKRFYAVRDKKSPLHNIKIEMKDLFSLVLAISTFKQTSPKAFAKSCDNILISLGKNLKDEDQEQFGLIRSITASTQGIDGQSVALDDIEFEKLIRAIVEQNCFSCRISYPLQAKRAEIKNYMPLSFYFTNNTPYLYVFDLKKNEKRLLRATRIVDIEILDKKVDPKKVQAASVEIGPHFSGFGSDRMLRYIIHCDDIFATFFLERPFVKPFMLKEIKDSFQLSFDLNENEQIIRLLASWSPHISDIFPKNIKSKVLETLKNGIASLDN